jgi:hypothetical protein
MEFAVWDMPTPPSLNPPAAGDNRTVSSLCYLFPDSLAYHFLYDIGDTTNVGKLMTFAAAGFVFDPYSLGYDRYQSKGLFRDSLGIGYGYRLDTLWTYINYRLPLGYNSSSPDTLRFFISYYDIYRNNSGSFDYYSVKFQRDTNRKAIRPMINYANPIPDKGPYATSPKTQTKIEVDYILTDKDSGIVQPGYYRLNTLSLAIPNGGYSIPPGSCLAVLVQYIPGYNYNLDDTLTVRVVNTQRAENDRFVSESIQHNYISIKNWNYDTSYVLNMLDASGYNSDLHETMDLRYAIDEDKRGSYAPGYYAKPGFFMSLSIAEDDTMHFPIIQSPVVKPIENLVSNIYPNPATTQLTVDLNNTGNANMIIYNMLGQAVIEETLTDMSNKINIADLSQGMYVVKVIQNGKTHTVKMSKK